MTTTVPSHSSRVSFLYNSFIHGSVNFSSSCLLNSNLKFKEQRSSRICKASLITNPEDFEVGRSVGSYGFMNITSYSKYNAGAEDVQYSSSDADRLRVQDVGEGQVKIRLYEGRITQGPSKGTRVIFKVYPGQRAGGTEADMMAANELNAHLFLQSDPKDICKNIQILLGGFETQTGEQWLAFRNDGKYSAADYAKVASDKISKDSLLGEQNIWNPFEQELKIKRRSTIVEKDAAYLVPRLRDLAFSVDLRNSTLEESSGELSDGLWRRASSASAFSPKEKRAFGIADDIYGAGLLFAYLAFFPFCETGIMDAHSLQRLLENTFQLDLVAAREYCLADDRLLEAVKFLDLDGGSGWQLLQAMLNPDFRKRPVAEAVLNHQFMNAAVL
ncbi:hypothetical protein C5167_049579 [Papaver somniferum]|uniref:Protein kinase domain-containing protein n=1 Tax=Papaver somniferum TaxID=3469 RepID=A0A4Y7KQ73_PAPSO|nr:hypothetical protein C5167_049579 [Papaver somniferum]